MDVPQPPAELTPATLEALAAEMSQNMATTWLEGASPRPKLVGVAADGQTVELWSIPADQEISPDVEAGAHEHGIYLVRGLFSECVEEVAAWFTAAGCVAAIYAAPVWVMENHLYDYARGSGVDVEEMSTGPNALTLVAHWPAAGQTAVAVAGYQSDPTTGRTLGDPVWSDELLPDQRWLNDTLPAQAHP